MTWRNLGNGYRLEFRRPSPSGRSGRLFTLRGPDEAWDLEIGEGQAATGPLCEFLKQHHPPLDYFTFDPMAPDRMREATAYLMGSLFGVYDHHNPMKSIPGLEVVYEP